MSTRFWTARAEDDVKPGQTWTRKYAERWSASMEKGDVVFFIGSDPRRLLLGWGIIESAYAHEEYLTGDDEEANTPPYPTYLELEVTFRCEERLTESVPLAQLVASDGTELLPATYEDEYRHTYGGQLEIVPPSIAETLSIAVRKHVYSRIPAPRDVAGPADIFISYAHEDVAAATKIYQTLVRHGYQPWLDEVSLVPGQQWEIEIARAIRSSNVFIAVLSRASLDKRGYVQKELREGLEMLERTPASRIYLIPARLDDCTPYDPRLAQLHWVDLFPDLESGLDRLLRAVRTAYQRAR